MKRAPTHRSDNDSDAGLFEVKWENIALNPDDLFEAKSFAGMTIAKDSFGKSFVLIPIAKLKKDDILLLNRDDDTFQYGEVCLVNKKGFRYKTDSLSEVTYVVENIPITAHVFRKVKLDDMMWIDAFDSLQRQVSDLKIEIQTLVTSLHNVSQVNSQM
jgi:hypothetical protein